MIYQKFRPCELLQSFVECYFIWESGDQPVHDLVVESPPNNFCSIVFNLGDDYFLQNKKYDRLAVPRQFIAGLSTYSYKLFLNGRISIAGIVFRPTALNALFDLPAYEYLEERIPLTNVFKKSYINDLIKNITDAGENNDKVKLLEEFVLVHYNKMKPEPDLVDKAANLILEKNGMVHVTDILKEVFMSRRNFERRFFKKTGVSPKYYARLRRISYLTNLIAGKKKVDWASVFTECEFYDQSHFIKDFIEFTGRTPQQYLTANDELANIVEKPKTISIRN